MVVDLSKEGGVGYSKELEDRAVAEEAPLCALNNAEFAEEFVHNFAVVPIVEGVKVKVVEVGEKVEGWREPAERRN